MSDWEIRAKEPFSDPTRLTKWTIWSLTALAVVSVIGVGSDLLERQFLLQVQADQFASQDDLEVAEAANYLRQGMIGLAEVVAMLTSLVLSLQWIYRANLNARRLGAEGLEYSPGWAVGWFFIPLLCFWKPYTGLKEIWLASANPKQWKALTRPVLLPVWWTLWLVAVFVSTAASHVLDRAEEAPQFANALVLASHVAQIPLTVAFILLIRQIYRMQMEQSTLPAAPDVGEAIPASA